MAQGKRVKTASAGVYWREIEKRDGKGTERIYYIVYRQGGRGSKLIEEPVGRSSEGMNEEKASRERVLRMGGKMSNAQRREEAERAQRAKEAEAARSVTVGQLWESYLEAHSNNRSIRDDINRYSRHVAPIFANVAASEVETKDITAFRQKLERKGLSAQSVKHCMGILRRIYRYGKVQGLDIEEPIFLMPEVDNKKTENMTADQLAAYWQALESEPDQDQAAFFKLALLIGMRKGALCALKWSDIDFDRGMIRLCREAAKNGKESFIPLNDAARSVLDDVARTSEYVFPGLDGKMRSVAPKMGRRLRTAAGLPKDFRPVHALRHVFASQLASSGEVDIYTLQKLLTHQSPLMTERYAHLADEAMQRAASVANRIAGGGKKSE